MQVHSTRAHVARFGAAPCRCIQRNDSRFSACRLRVKPGKGLEAIDTTTPSGELIFHVFSALAQFERRLIQERTNAGLAAARARGHKGGRPRIKPNDRRIVLANKLFQDKSISLDDICATLKISKSTLYRYIVIGGGYPPSPTKRQSSQGLNGAA